MRCLRSGVLTVAIATAIAVQAEPTLDERVKDVAAELRCLVCQNQSIAESNATLAVDLRRQIAELMQQGKTDDEIRAYMTARYGDFVLYRPPLKPTTVLLWLGPFVLLGAGLLVYLRMVRRRRPADAPPATPEQLDQILKG